MANKDDVRALVAECEKEADHLAMEQAFGEDLLRRAASILTSQAETIARLERELRAAKVASTVWAAIHAYEQAVADGLKEEPDVMALKTQLDQVARILNPGFAVDAHLARKEGT